MRLHGFGNDRQVLWRGVLEYIPDTQLDAVRAQPADQADGGDAVSADFKKTVKGSDVFCTSQFTE